MKLLFACDREMLIILHYLNLIYPELKVAKYPLVSNTTQLLLPSKTSTHCRVFKDAIYATHLNSLVSKKKLYSFTILISKEQSLLFQTYKKNFYQTTGLIAVATLTVIILTVVLENNQIVNYTYKGVLAIACSYIIYHGNRTLLEINRYDAYKQLLKLAQFQD